MEWTGTTSESGPIRPKQTKKGTIVTNKTPAEAKHSNYGP